MRVLFGPKKAASLVWSNVNRAARFARDREWIRSEKLSAFTIGVGNLQAGGAGKTPLTIRIARDAIAQGMQVAVLMRGYRSAWEKSGGILSPHEPIPSPELCGDEPALIRDRVPGVWIGVGADRLHQFEAMQSQVAQLSGRQFDLVILDDAFQHWKIKCDQYVLVVTDAQIGERVFRDDFDSVRNEDLVFLIKGKEFPEALMNHERKVKAHFQIPPPTGKKNYRFVAAIGDPERAKKSFLESGYRIVEMTVFPDHHTFTLSEIDRILSEASALSQTVLLSGKDWVKWRALGATESQVEVIEPEIEIDEGFVHWNALLPEKA